MVETFIFLCVIEREQVNTTQRRVLTNYIELIASKIDVQVFQVASFVSLLEHTRTNNNEKGQRGSYTSHSVANSKGLLVMRVSNSTSFSVPERYKQAKRL